ncbi:AAA family ATPase [Brasilonema bromeliae]|uniref:UDP-N-acetylglucosamine kinase n=1 Tax=Brasilonema bromeliae SPC951 TaxID=385972 RepID=A0ABX1P7L2_9CYAN|nr:AAA family ATPase [Brasilonema bromeliae]NMG20383.1 hypothetical protein [Brasilonema bromeliae SPC951]
MPRVAIVAGINGAGKTTASQRVLRDLLQMPCFVNADALARGLNGFNPESEAAKAGRLMLDHLHELATAGKDFSFETTLSGRAYAPWLRDLRANGYEVYLYYYWLRSPELAVERVANRVRSGGHHIPEPTIRQRYAKSIRNFFDLFRQQADYWEVCNNSNGRAVLFALGNPTEELVVDETLWAAFHRSGQHG